MSRYLVPHFEETFSLFVFALTGEKPRLEDGISGDLVENCIVGIFFPAKNSVSIGTQGYNGAGLTITVRVCLIS